MNKFYVGNIVLRTSPEMDHANMKAGQFYTVAEATEMGNIKLYGVIGYFNTDYFELAKSHVQPVPPCPKPVNVPVPQAPPKQDFNQGEPQVLSNQAPQVALPFDFTRKAIEDITHVYGTPVKQLNVNSLTAALTNRQAEVDRLKALPHKPEVIKAKIATLKGEIKDILALANELFPVTA